MSQQPPRAALTLEASVSPSEDLDKVIAALRSVTGDAEVEVVAGADAVRLLSKDPRALQRLKDQFRDRHVRSAARRRLLASIHGTRTTLMLNRQAATKGVLVLCGSPGESPLGPIYATIRSEKLETVIDWLSGHAEE